METEKPLTGEAIPQETSAVPQSSESQQKQADAPQTPDPTHEAYIFDKASGKKTVIAQGTQKQIKDLLRMNRRPGFWLYMRPVEEERPRTAMSNEEFRELLDSDDCLGWNIEQANETTTAFNVRIRRSGGREGWIVVETPAVTDEELIAALKARRKFFNGDDRTLENLNQEMLDRKGGVPL